MLSKRTDLAAEAHSLWKESAGETTELAGVRARADIREGLEVTTVEILDEEGERALGKPCGTYVTVELPRDLAQVFEQAVRTVAAELKRLCTVGEDEPILVAGLGNRRITADAIGPRTVEYTMVTRHLVEKMPEHFGHFRQISAMAPGVLGLTGVESVDMIKGVCNQTHPAAVIAIDALASTSLARLCRTIQIADTGIVPGSGVGNARAAINRETLGIPVVALGVPTVVEAATLAVDLIREAAGQVEEPDSEVLRVYGGDMVVCPKDIDRQVEEIAKVVGYAVNTAFHKDLSMEDITAYIR